MCVYIRMAHTFAWQTPPNSSDSASSPPPAFPITRTINIILDHVTATNLSTQRWSAATLRNLLLLDPAALSHLTDSGGILILTSLLGGSDTDTRAHAAAALQTAVVASGYSEGVLQNIATACDFKSAIPPLISTSTNPRILATSLELLASLLHPITADGGASPSASHPSHSIAINLHHPEIISSFIDLVAFKASLDLTAASYTAILTALAGICVANANSDILPTTSLASTCLSLLSQHPSHADKQLLELILTTFTPEHDNPTVALTQFLNTRLIPPAAKIINTYQHNHATSYDLLLCCLDNGAITLVFEELANSLDNKDAILPCLQFLNGLSRIAFAPNSPHPDTAKERYESALQHYSSTSSNDSSVIQIVSNHLTLPDSFYDAPAGMRNTLTQIITSALDIISSFADQEGSLIEIIHRLFLPAESPMTSLLIHPPTDTLITTCLTIFHKVAKACPIASLSNLSECSALSVIPDIMSNSLNSLDFNHFNLSLGIVQSLGPHTAPSSTIGRSSINTIKTALGREDIQEIITRSSIFTLESLSVNSSLWASIGGTLPYITATLLNTDDDKELETACLTTIQRIIPLPANATAAASSGVAISMVAMVTDKAGGLAKPALEVLHALCQHKSARHPTLIHQGAINAACYALANLAKKTPAIATKALEILGLLLSDGESYDKVNTHSIRTAVTNNSNAVRMLCVSLGLDIARSLSMDEDLFLNLYGKWKTVFSGPQIVMVKKILFAFAAHFSDEAVDDGNIGGNAFWDKFGYEDVSMNVLSDNTTTVVSSMCCALLEELTVEEEDEEEEAEEGGVTVLQGLGDKLPCVKHHLLLGLSICIKNGYTPAMERIIVKYDLFQKAVESTLLNPSTLMVGELLSNYTACSVKCVLQTEDVLLLVTGMLKQADVRVREVGGSVLGVCCEDKDRCGLFVSAISKAGVRGEVIEGLCRGIGGGDSFTKSLTRIAEQSGFSGGEAGTVARAVSGTLSSKIVAGGDARDAANLLCLLARHEGGVGEVVKGGGLGALCALKEECLSMALGSLVAVCKEVERRALVVESEGHLRALEGVVGGAERALGFELLNLLWSDSIEVACGEAVTCAIEVVIGGEDAAAGLCEAISLLVEYCKGSVANKIRVVEGRGAAIVNRLIELIKKGGRVGEAGVELLSEVLSTVAGEDGGGGGVAGELLELIKVAEGGVLEKVVEALHHLSWCVADAGGMAATVVRRIAESGESGALQVRRAHAEGTHAAHTHTYANGKEHRSAILNIFPSLFPLPPLPALLTLASLF